MDYLLHIDTSAAPGIVALTGDGNLLAYRTILDARDQASVINTLIHETADEAGLKLANLSAIVVCAGPGSYTGLRIGMATAKALCYVLDKPLLLDNKLTLLAYQLFYSNYKQYDVFMALLKARDKEYFITTHDENFNCIIQPKHVFEDELKDIFTDTKKVLITTDVSTENINMLMANEIEITADVNINIQLWSKYAYEGFKCNRIVNLSTAEPFYLKQAYTT